MGMKRTITFYIGDRFTRLVICSLPEKYTIKSKATCRCDCGAMRQVALENLRHQRTKSCGCYSRDRTKNGTHKLTGSPEYISWAGAKSRCYNKNNPKYSVYGARGIRLSEAWRESFESFLKDMGKRYSDKFSLDRIDTNGDYCKENCRWATQKQQQNNRRNNKIRRA